MQNWKMIFRRWGYVNDLFLSIGAVHSLKLTRNQRTKQPHTIQSAGLPFHELAALRMAGSTSRFKPAEEQFIEQTPWANPQHPSHAHLLQRQTSAQQTPRTASPFSQPTQPRRHSDQHGPTSGTFSSPTLNGPAFSNQASGGVSPHNPVTNPTHAQTVAPLPLDNRQTSLSPLMTRPKVEEGPKSNGNQRSSPVLNTGFLEKPREFPQEVRREQAPTITGHF
jgi:hypothetical protein